MNSLYHRLPFLTLCLLFSVALLISSCTSSEEEQETGPVQNKPPEPIASSDDDTVEMIEPLIAPREASPAEVKVDEQPKPAPPENLVKTEDPEIERRTFELLDGFEVNLFAAEPMLANPIHMTFDPEGRLWVVCSWAYPQIEPGETPNDKIIVLEDTDHDGRADKSTVFAEGLYVPTGLELGDGGVYVANAPDLLFLKDTDGDGKADERRVVLTGFATEDNHHSISAWRWGPGGWLYFQEGTFMHSQVETAYGPVRLRYGGVFQFRPDREELRVFADYRASNPWGHTFDRWGQSVLIDNPNLYFLAPLTANSRAKLGYESSGKGIKQAGGEFVSGRHLPKEYRGEIWTNQYKTNTVARYRVEDDGAGFKISNLDPVMTSSSQNFRPVDLKIGPDGAAYVLDWYNPLIGHMQHSFRDPRRDNSHGRVWRITAKDSSPVERPQLTNRPVAEILDYLKVPEDFSRNQVKRVLSVADPQETTDALNAWVDKLDTNDPRYAHNLLEALWCFQTIDIVNEDLLKTVLHSENPKARAAAFRVLRYWHDKVKDPLKLLEEGVADEHPRVRMEAVLTLGYIPDPQSVVIAVRASDKELDRYLEHALKLTIDGLQPQWLEANRAGTLKFDTPEHESYALSNVLSSDAVRSLLAILNSGHIDEAAVRRTVDAVANSANSQQLEPLVLTLAEITREFKTTGKPSISPTALTLILDALNTAARTRGIVPTGNLSLLIKRASSLENEETQIALMNLIGAWNLTSEAERTRTISFATDRSLPLRVAAARALAEVGDPEDRKRLRGLANASQSRQNNYVGMLGVIDFDMNYSAVVAAMMLESPLEIGDPAELVYEFTSRRGGAQTLERSIRFVAPENANAMLQRFRETGEQNLRLIRKFGGKIENSSLEATLGDEDAKTLAAEVLEKGNSERGEMIFRRADLACFACHAVNKAGPDLGPELAAIGSAAPPDYLVDSLLRPSKVIKEFYEPATVVTTDGKVLNGILKFKGENEVVLKDAAQKGKQITIPSVQIDELVESKVSIMPLGLAAKLADRQEFLDLVKFLSVLGKPGEYAVSNKPLIRRWRVKTINLKEDETLELSTLEDNTGWTPAYSLVSGALPLEEFPASTLLAAFGEVQVTRSGTANVIVEETAGLRLILNDQEAELKPQTEVQLPPGTNRLLFLIDREARSSKTLRVELQEVPGGASFEIVEGI